MQQKSNGSSSEHSESPDMHHNEAYGYADPAQLRMLPETHREIPEMKQVTLVHGDQIMVNVASTSHIETEPEYSTISVPVSSKSHQVASSLRVDAQARSLKFAGVRQAGSQMKTQKRLSMDYNKLEHHTGTQPLDAIHSASEQVSPTVDHMTTSPEQKLASKLATLPSRQPTHKSQAEHSQLNLSLPKDRCDTYIQMQHNQEQQPCLEETLTALGEHGSIGQASIPMVLVDQELSDNSNHPLQQSKH